MLKIQFRTEKEKYELIENNKDKFLISVMYLFDGNFLLFSDKKPSPTIEDQYNELLNEQGNKISILEAENEKLKQELSITQDAVNELIFNSLNI